MKIKETSRAGLRLVLCSLPDMVCAGDLLDGRDCVIRLQYTNTSDTRPHARMPHFSLPRSNAGVAFPELMRAYSQLFSEVADFVEGKEPIDYQI